MGLGCMGVTGLREFPHSAPGFRIPAQTPRLKENASCAAALRMRARRVGSKPVAERGDGAGRARRAADAVSSSARSLDRSDAPSR